MEEFPLDLGKELSSEKIHLETENMRHVLLKEASKDLADIFTSLIKQLKEIQSK